jgi:L-ascorbate metabolism protein UlaG (beta-lactamase superfamily)
MTRKGRGWLGMAIVSGLVLLCIFTQCSTPPPVFDEEEWLKKVDAVDSALLYAPHQKPDGTFFNPWLQREKRYVSGSWFRYAAKKYDSFSQTEYAHVPNDYAYLSDSNFDSISYAGHASFIIKTDGETIFTDPFFSNAALVVRKKVRIKFDFSRVPDRPVVLISHNHYDHLDTYSIKKLVKNDPVFVVPLGLKDYISKLGAKEVHELDWWESVTLGPLTYTFLPAQHWSRRIGQKGGSSLWGGFLIEGSKTIYFSGDSGYFIGFKEFGTQYDIDYALLGAGAYEPRWFMYYSHMNVEEFFRAADDLGAKTAVPFHFGVIKLSEEPLLYPLYEISEHIASNPEYSERVRPLRVGGDFGMSNANEERASSKEQ